MQTDTIFDQLAERFERKIYGSGKGDLRLALLWDDLVGQMPALLDPAAHWHILDAGGGLGQVSQRLAALGHTVVLAEPSATLLARARTLMAAAQTPLERVTFLPSTIQALEEQHRAHPDLPARYDLVVCHAVLEWLADPQATLQVLLRQVPPGGWLSLAFYNRESIVWKNLLKGNLRKVQQGQLAGEPGSLTPQHPQSAPAVLAWLAAAGLETVQVTGIRCLHDYLYPGVEIAPDDLLAVERELAHREPYKWLGRYIHVMARRPAAAPD